MLVPAARTEQDLTALGTHYRSGLDAIIQGTLTGAKMAFNIAALLIVFIGIMALADQALAALPHQGAPLTLTAILKIPFIPVAWLMGVPFADIGSAASLLGTKLSLNEVVAYVELAKMAPILSAKAQIMAAVTLCSFGNIASVAILIGALNTMAPERAADIVPMGFRALATAFLVNCVAGTIIGVAPEGFIGAMPGIRTDVFLPLAVNLGPGSSRSTLKSLAEVPRNGTTRERTYPSPISPELTSEKRYAKWGATSPCNSMRRTCAAQFLLDWSSMIRYWSMLAWSEPT